MDHFTLVDAAGLFLGALAVLIVQSGRQAPAEGAFPLESLRARLWPRGAVAGPAVAAGADDVLFAGPVVGRLREADCHAWVMLRDGRRMAFAGAVSLLPDGTPDLRWMPGDGLVLHGSQLYLAEDARDSQAA